MKPATIMFRALGDPKGQPRPRAFHRPGMKGARVYDPGTAEGWKSQIAQAAILAVPFEPWTGPVKVCISFFMRRPKCHFRTGKNSHILKDSAPVWHTKKPDADNLAKAVLDALTQLAFWSDDCVVCDLRAFKAWSNRPGAEIEISQIPDIATPENGKV